MSLADNLRIIFALQRRALNEILRVPGAAIPGVLAPAIFLLGMGAVFGAATEIRGFDESGDYRTFLIAVPLVQAAGFTGSATGVNLARDIEQGWFDRLLVAPASRPVLLAGVVFSASLRVFMPVTFLLAVGFAIGVDWPGFDGLLLLYLIVPLMSAVAACWGAIVALRARTQAAAPLIQVVVFASVLVTTAYAPEDVLSGWVGDVAPYNPVTYVIESVRQGFIGSVTWDDTWPGIVACVGMLIAFGTLAVREMSLTGR